MIKKMETLNTLSNTHSTNTIEDPAIFKLDDDCMRHIFSYLSIPERIRVQRVCKTWQLLGKLPWTDQKRLILKNGMYDHYTEEDAVTIRNLIYTLPILEKVLSLCGSSLTSISIDYFDEENTAVGILTLIHKYCPNLLRLNLHGIELTRTVLEYLCCHYTNLKHVYIRSCDSQCEDALLRFFQLNAKLSSVSFDGSDDLKGNCFQGLPDTIEEIEIDDCERLEVKNMLNNIQRWNNLRSLSIGNNIALLLHMNLILDALPNKLKLEELLLDTLTLDSSDGVLKEMNNLHYFTNLRMIKLTGDTVLFDQILTELGKHCVHLTHAYLARSDRITDVGWENFVKFLNLEVLIVYELKGLSNKFLNYLPKSSLKTVKCGLVPVTNETLQLLILNSENLELMEICDCKNVNTDKLQNDALAITNLQPHNKILRLHYNSKSALRSVDNGKMVSPRLIVKKIYSKFY